MKPHWKERIGLLSLFLTILTFVITVTINFVPLYSWDIGYLKILDWVDLSKGELTANYRILLQYLNLPWIPKLILPDFPVSESGAFHFYEVKKLFLLNYSVLLVTLIPSILYLKTAIQQQRLWKLVRPFQVAASLPIFLGFIMLVAFDQFFVLFHQLFFNNDDWLFDPVTDPIIMALPEEFFMHCFIFAFLLLEILLLTGIYFGRREQRLN